MIETDTEVQVKLVSEGLARSSGTDGIDGVFARELDACAALREVALVGAGVGVESYEPDQ